MSTVFVIGRFPPPVDGQTLATLRLAELLAPTHTVHRVSTSVPEPDYVQTEVRFRLDRVLHYAQVLPRLQRATALAPRAPVLWGSVSPVPLGHWRDLATTLPAFRPEQPVFALLHRAGIEQLFASPLTAASARYLERRLRGFVFLNESLARAAARYIPDEKRIVIPNTIDDAALCSEAELEEKRRDRAERPGLLRLLFLSNMMREKGYLDVLEAARLLRNRGCAFRLDFAGRWATDADRAEFEALVARNGLTDVVVHHGPVADRARVRALHLQADVFLLPSYHPTESMPLAILEALNAGTPALVSEHGGLPEIVRDDRDGLVVPPRDPASLAAAVAMLFDPVRWQRLSAGARRRFETTYSPAAVRRQWLALLDTVLGV